MSLEVDTEKLKEDIVELEEELEYLIKRSIQQKKDIEEAKETLEGL